MDIKDYILEVAQRKNALPEGIDFEAFEYLDSGFMDSLGVLEFIMAIEEELEIRFSEQEMDSPSFRTLGGLRKILENKLNML